MRRRLFFFFPFFLPPSSSSSQRPQQKASLICSWEQPLTPVWLLGSERGVDGVEPAALKNHLPASSLVYVTTQLQKAHTGIIFTLLHYFPRAPPREREWRSVYCKTEEEEEEEEECISKYIRSVNGWPLTETRGVKHLWKHEAPLQVGTFSYAGDVKCSTLKSLFVDITHSRLQRFWPVSREPFAPRLSHSGRMFPLTLAEVIPVGPWRLCPSMRGGVLCSRLARAAEQLPNLSS